MEDSNPVFSPQHVQALFQTVSLLLRDGFIIGREEVVYYDPVNGFTLSNLVYGGSCFRKYDEIKITEQAEGRALGTI